MRTSATPRLVRALRLTRLLLHLTRGATIMLCLFPLVGRHSQRYWIQQWSRQLLTILRVRVNGAGLGRFAPRAVVVANHVSWLDISLLNSMTAMCFVAKSEIRGWPVVGWMAAKAGTLFIERARRRDTVRINDHIQGALDEREVVVIFPEGATTDGTELRAFHASLLQPAIDAQASVIPVAIRYLHLDGRINTDAAYIDDMSLWQSVKRILAHPEIHVEIIQLDPIDAGGKSRRDLAREAEHRVRTLLISRTPPETAGDPPAEPR